MKRSLRQCRNRREVAELVFTTSQAQELEWEEEQEFRWKGEMYDVIEKRTEQDTIFIRCIPDKKEKQLLQEYQKNSERNQGRGKTSLVKLITTSFLAPTISVPAAPQATLEKNRPGFFAFLFSIPHTIQTPPPKVYQIAFI